MCYLQQDTIDIYCWLPETKTDTHRHFGITDHAYLFLVKSVEFFSWDLLGMLKSQAFIVGLCLGLTLGILVVPLVDRTSSAWCGHPDPRPTRSPNLGSTVPQPNSGRALSALVPRGAKQSWRRPRYMSTELELRKKLIVGIIVEGQQFHSDELVPLLNGTLHRHVNKLVFFFLQYQNGDSVRRTPNAIFLNVSSASESNDRSFKIETEALKYFVRVFCSDYDFFALFRADYYVNGALLSDLVAETSVGEPVFWRNCGFNPGGSGTYETLGTSGGRGLLISRGLLQSIFEQCNKTGETVHDSCLDQAISGLHCSPKFKSATSKEVSAWENSILIGPPENAIEFRKIHDFLCNKRKQRLVVKVSLLQAKMERIHLRTHSRSDKGLSWPIGFTAPVKPRSRGEILQWVYFTRNEIFHTSEHFTNKSLTEFGVDQMDIADLLTNSAEFLQSQPRNGSEFLYGYRRFDPGRGMEYVLDFGKDSEIIRIQGLRPLLGPVELVPMPFVEETGRITLVIPVTSSDINLHSIGKFLNRWVNDSAFPVTESKASTGILLVLTSPRVPRPQIEAVKKLIGEFNSKISSTLSKIGYIVLTIPPPSPDTKVSTLIAIFDQLINKKHILKPESLVALLDEVNLDFHDEFLNRVRMNTVRTVQIWSPIPFVEYLPDLTNNKHHNHEEVDSESVLHIHKASGYFQPDDYGFLSFYIADYSSAREYMQHLPHEAQNFANFVDIFLRDTLKLHVLRTPEPDLKIRRPESSDRGFNVCASDSGECFKRASANKEQLASLVLNYLGNLIQ